MRQMRQEWKLGNTRYFLEKGDLTEASVDAIVNAANSSLMGGGGVDGAIHARGGPAILEECRRIIARIGRCETGQAVLTGGGNLPARHVIHTVGPVWKGGRHGEAELLRCCYRASLELAQRSNLRSVAFPSISTGAFGYPLDQAATVAQSAVIEFLDNSTTSSLTEVGFVLFGDSAYEVYLAALRELRSGLF